ncbi:MAG: DUF2975 domain-containing protein [Oscillospiraceae bacterium]|nr:DUF2975 domain-containing protein [Oscillospiraceae bacterium]
MSQKQCANLLKVVLIAAAIAVTFVYFYLAPMVAKTFLALVPAYAFAYWPWLGFVLISCIPVYIALVEVWAIFTRIGRDRSFCPENADSMRAVAILAGAEALYLLLGFGGMWIWSMHNGFLRGLFQTHPGIFFIFVFLAFAAGMVCALCAALTMLIRKANRLQEENDLTI